MFSLKSNVIPITWAVLLIGSYSIMFWGLERDDFIIYFSLISVAFICHLYPFSKWGKFSKPVLFIMIGLIIRLMAVSVFPVLSEDIYRYIWDGYLSQSGVSPYAFTPEECIRLFSVQEHPFLHSLFPLLNSPNYYSVYPPIAQVFFSFGGWLGACVGLTAAVVGLKALLLLAEFVGWFFVYQMFQSLKGDKNWYWALWLNPLLILEWSFSGHVESLAFCFLIISVFIIWMKKSYLSAIFLAFAVLTKLWPLLFAPFFLKFIQLRKEQFKWISAFIVTGAIGSIPLLIEPAYFIHFKNSVDLYFRTFEFNASVYYLFRAIGSWWYGYNPIHHIGPLCTILMLGSCVWLYRIMKVPETRHLMDSLIICGIVYLLLATTVHPWYLSLFLPFAYINGRWSIVLWSYLILASYHAYTISPVRENIAIVTFTYSIIFLTLHWDWKKGRKVNL